MGFEDFLENKHHGKYRKHNYHDEDRYSHNSHHGHNDNHFEWLQILEKVRNNKKLKLLIIVGGIFILLIAIVLIIYLLPFIIKLINYISQNGLQGVFDSITNFFDKIWKGSAK